MHDILCTCQPVRSDALDFPLISLKIPGHRIFFQNPPFFFRKPQHFFGKPQKEHHCHDFTVELRMYAAEVKLKVQTGCCCWVHVLRVSTVLCPSFDIHDLESHAALCMCALHCTVLPSEQTDSDTS